MESTAECLANAAQCEQMAAETSLESVRMLLQRAALQWRKLAAEVATLEALRDAASMTKDNELTSSRYWRERAEEARTKVEEMHDAHSKATMLRIATLYDQKADLAAKRGAISQGR